MVDITWRLRDFCRVEHEITELISESSSWLSETSYYPHYNYLALS